MDWFWLWMLFVFAFLLLPLGYGWGYRGWGAPYPSYYARRRPGAASPAADRYAEARAVETEETSAWGGPGRSRLDRAARGARLAAAGLDLLTRGVRKAWRPQRSPAHRTSQRAVRVELLV